MSYPFLQLKKHSNAVKLSRRLNKEQIKKQLFDSFVYDDTNKKDLSARADVIKDYQEAVEIIKECKNIIRTNKKKILDFAYKQGKIFEKFNVGTTFKNLVEQFGISKSTIIFKINIVKLVDKYKDMVKSSVALNF